MNMRFDEYQTQTHKTNIVKRDLMLQYLSTGLAGETGELCSLVAKRYRKDTNDLDEVMFEEYRQKVKGELGDILWFVSELATLHGFALSQVANANLTKLTDRMVRGVIKGNGDER